MSKTRIRISYSRGPELKFISHLDLMRLWIRALRRARVPLTYSEGFAPHPKIAMAAPLSVGVTAEAELMDVTVDKAVSPHWFREALNQQLPAGLEVIDVFTIAPTLPSLQSQVRFAMYRVEINTNRTLTEIETGVKELLARENIPWHHQRDTGRREYNLRRLIETIEVTECREDICTLSMILRCDESGSGRPEQVVYALGFNEYPRSIKRRRLILGSTR